MLKEKSFIFTRFRCRTAFFLVPLGCATVIARKTQKTVRHEGEFKRDRIEFRLGRPHRGHRLTGRRIHQRHIHRPHRSRCPRLHPPTQEQGRFPRRAGHDGQHPPGHGTHPPRRHCGRRRPAARGDDRRPGKGRAPVPRRRGRRILGRNGLHRRHGCLQQGRLPGTGPQGRRRHREIPVQLDDFTEPLAETIKGFHNIRHRFGQWDAALARDAAGRKMHLAGEIGWIESRRARCSLSGRRSRTVRSLPA